MFKENLLLPFFLWLQELGISNYFLQTTWASPIVQCIHLVALVVFTGALLVVDIRLLGGGLTSRPRAELTREAEKWMIGGFLVLLVTGALMGMSLALKQYYSPFFWWKMRLLLFGVVFTFTIRRRVALAEEGRFGSVLPKAVAVMSMAIWGGVAIWARLIGLFS